MCCVLSLPSPGMTKVKVGKEDSSSGEFVERRRAALERYASSDEHHGVGLECLS